MMKNRCIRYFLAVVMSTTYCISAVTTSTVQYLSGKDTVKAFLCAPEGKGPFPAIIIIHEWWGLNDWIKNNAKRLASQGYITLAVDLYHGKVTTSPDQAHEFMRGLPEDRAARDLQSAVQYLRTRSDVNAKRIGSIGWCMGGGYSLVTALNIPDLAACVICYGRLVTDTASISNIPCPMLGIFGKDDQGITAESVREFEATCKKARKEIEVTMYENAGHAFMNPENKKGYRKTAAQDAWLKIDSFFARTLKK
ncbi:MAG: dienelactone hydrolase family protein [Ignavibacteriae bacterium]|nr:dienelactone hydrolase family protein [Ignavibacteriota bacterium]